MPQDAFRKGFLDGWSSLRGDEPAPPVPVLSVERGEDTYRSGVARAVSASRSKARLKSTVAGTEAMDAWFDKALRR
jgi:hypothetical protein